MSLECSTEFLVFFSWEKRVWICDGLMTGIVSLLLSSPAQSSVELTLLFKVLRRNDKFDIFPVGFLLCVDIKKKISKWQTLP